MMTVASICSRDIVNVPHDALQPHTP